MRRWYGEAETFRSTPAPPQGLLAWGAARVPDVLADAQADEVTAYLENRGARALAEVAILVEDTVVRQVALVIAVQNLAARGDGAGVVEVSVEVDETDRRRHPFRHPARELLQSVQVVPDEARPEEQVLRRVTGRGQLRESDDLGAALDRLGEGVRRLLHVPPHVAYDCVDLGQRHLHKYMIKPSATCCQPSATGFARPRRRKRGLRDIRIRAVGTREDQPNVAEGQPSYLSASPLRCAALAAGLLEGACAPGSGDPLRLEVVRTLARDLRVEIEGLAELANRDIVVVEGALRAADVANLAASALPELPEGRAPEVAASAHLAAGAARALHTLAEAYAARTSGERARSAFGDARGVAWRARLAARQVDEFLEGEG